MRSRYNVTPDINIYIVSTEGGEPVRVTQSDGVEDGAPCWSSDGCRIAIESQGGQDEDSPSALWIIAAPKPAPGN